MYLATLFFLGLTYAVNARDCLNPTEVDHFDMKKFEGDWYELSFNSPNQTDFDEYVGVGCILLKLKAEDNHFDCSASYNEEGKVKTLVGKYTLADVTKGHFSVNFPEHQQYNQYDYKILCTDYTHYAIIYTSAQYEAGHCSEFVVIKGRENTKYHEITDMDEVKQCLHDKVDTAITDMRLITNNECH